MDALGYPVPLRPDFKGLVAPTLVGKMGAAPSGGDGVQPRDYYFHDNLGQFLEANSWSSKTEFLEIGNFWLLVVVRVKIRALSHREIMFHVWKYIRTIIIDQYAVCGLLLDN